MELELGWDGFAGSKAFFSAVQREMIVCCVLVVLSCVLTE